MAEGLLDKANIILTPTGYKAGTMYNVAPIEQPYEDFVFSRASVASRVNSSGLVEMVGRTLGSNLVQNGDFSEIGPDLVQNGDFSELGSELVTDGDFPNLDNWSVNGGDYATIVDGALNSNNPENGNWHTEYISQNISFVTGETYKISFKAKNISGDPNLRLTQNGYVIFTDNITSSFVDYEVYYTANADNGSIRIFCNSAIGEFQIDNVSVKEVPDWSLGTGWSVEDNKAIYSGTANANLSQSGILTSSKQYKLEYEVISSTLVGGIVKLSGETASAQNVLSQSVGTHTLYFTADGTSPADFNIRVVINTSGQYEITNIVVQELDPNDYWNLETGWSLGDNQAIKTGSVASNFYQYSVFTTGKTYKLTFTISNSNDGRLLVYVGGNSVTEDITNTSDGTYTFYANSDNVNLVFRNVTFEGSITNVTAKEVIDTNNIPRINYDSNGENGHWLLEPTSTNLVPYSEDFTQGWAVSDATITPNSITSPSGQDNASTLTTSASGGTVQETLTISDGDLTFSLFVRKGTTNGVRLRIDAATDVNGYFNIDNGTIFSQTDDAKIEVINADWYRVSISASVTSFVKASIYTTDGTTSYDNGTVYIWGGQLEALPYATSYIPTLTGSTETRATETAAGAGSADLINSTEGVLYGEIAVLEGQTNINRYITINNGTDDNFVSVHFRNNTNNQIRAIVRVSNSNKCDFTYNPSGSTSFAKFALKWKANDFALWVNGVEIGSDTSGSTFSANTLNNISFDSGQGSDDFYGKCKALAVFDEALSDSELTELTS